MSAAIVFVIIIPVLHYISTQKYGTMVLLVGLILIFRIRPNEYRCPGGESPFTYLYILSIGVLAAEKNWLCFKQNDLKHFLIETFLLGFLYCIYLVLPVERFWEFSWNCIPFFLIIYCWKWIIRIPIIKDILYFIGKHSMNIFLIHTFIRDHYLHDFIYSLKYFLLIIIVLLFLSIILSILIEQIKRIVGYNQLIKHLIENVPAFSEKD